MAEPDQPKKETVRIQLPVPPATKPPEPNVNPRETVRIQLPVREVGKAPGGPSPQSAPEDISSTNFFPAPKPPVASRPSAASMRPPAVPPSLGPKKETVRIPVMPEPMTSAQKKTQPLMAMPDTVVPQNPAIAMAPQEKSPMLLYWMLLGISALILIIQIWTYFS
jgi:hypothetical protein